MKPVIVATHQHKLHGIHYFVDQDERLQAYEYAPYAPPT